MRYLSKRGLLPMCWMLLLVSGLCYGSSWSFRDPHDAMPQNAEEYEWEEGKVDLPPFPQDDQLLEVHFENPDARFDYFIDPGSLSVGEDGVVRYVLVTRSRSGAKNVLYEGIRCHEYDYKTFAYGSTRNRAFKVMRNARWKEISETHNNWFRHSLWKHYFCIPENKLNSRSRLEILNDIEFYRSKGQGRN